MTYYSLVYSNEGNYIRAKKEDKEREAGDKGKENDIKYTLPTCETVKIKPMSLHELYALTQVFPTEGILLPKSETKKLVSDFLPTPK